VKSGFVAVVGRPNVGKSTLVNSMVGTKVAITSPRPQTTRNVIRGVVTIGDTEPTAQIVLVDTPGLHKPKNALGERLNTLVYGTLAEVDAVVFVLDATQRIGPGDRRIAERLASASSPVIVVVNKLDLAGKADVVDQLGTAGEWGFESYVPVTAITGEGTDRVISELLPHLPEGPLYFPADATSDQPEELLAAEIVREKFLSRLREELPHSLTVRTRDMHTRDDGLLHIEAQIVVERSSQKGIVIGQAGSVLGAAGAEARKELESIFGTKVFLDLRVVVEKDWQRRPQLLDRLGFDH
jgi:GTP-binding protein Era